jgi:hypothetical protein
MADTYGRVLREETDQHGNVWMVVEPDPSIVAAVAERDRRQFRRAIAAVEARRARGADPQVRPMHTTIRDGEHVIAVDCTLPRGQCRICDGWPWA